MKAKQEDIIFEELGKLVKTRSEKDYLDDDDFGVFVNNVAERIQHEY